LHGWQANKKRTCAPPVSGRAMPENEKPPAMRVDIYFVYSVANLRTISKLPYENPTFSSFFIFRQTLF